MGRFWRSLDGGEGDGDGRLAGGGGAGGGECVGDGGDGGNGRVDGGAWIDLVTHSADCCLAAIRPFTKPIQPVVKSAGLLLKPLLHCPQVRKCKQLSRGTLDG